MWALIVYRFHNFVTIWNNLAQSQSHVAFRLSLKTVPHIWFDLCKHRRPTLTQAGSNKWQKSFYCVRTNNTLFMLDFCRKLAKVFLNKLSYWTSINSSWNPERAWQLSGNVSTSKVNGLRTYSNSFAFLGIIKSHSCITEAKCFLITSWTSSKHISSISSRIWLKTGNDAVFWGCIFLFHNFNFSPKASNFQIRRPALYLALAKIDSWYSAEKIYQKVMPQAITNIKSQ